MRAPMQRLKDKMSICERTLMSHHTPAATVVKALSNVSDTVMELHSLGQLDTDKCIHEFNLIADTVFLQLDNTNPQVLASVCDLLRALSVCCGEMLRPTADALISDIFVLCGHSARNVAFHAKECVTQWTQHTSYALQPVVTIPDARFRSHQDNVLYAYHFALQVPTICDQWQTAEIAPYHEEIFQVLSACIEDDNTTIRVAGFKALSALFDFQRHEMKMSATLLAESYLGAISKHIIHDILRELPQSLLAQTLSAYHARQSHAAPTPKFRTQELMYQTPRRQQAPKSFQSRMMLAKGSPAIKAPSTYFAQRRPVQEDAGLRSRRPRQPLFASTDNTAVVATNRWDQVGKLCRMGGRGCRWLVDQVLPRRVQRWLTFWITVVSVVFTLVSVLYWVLLAPA
ncbi:hypothetical protein SDRG_04711 [Saprolegnia diclina VS20]|uniref:TOG domain-containing protein n=1 Tax=Saprolegnia diclina (strain VS20) TaxID=1156394 RepID=T0QSJ6_SAPDV|nr:hypothetical protein SDRG_04711 [Saprolegnia diclina VS20]EQC37681.1 hypothetical protein SDRG_04711 [Saprolegnia diclina VS20]|eukprot:XP_008608614.1 hypothetical protein SDRG_04711 [Saprolegnia diclina VS20]